MKHFVIFGALLTIGHALPKPPYGNWNNADTLIVGGTAVEQGELPYQLALLQNNELICGASLIEVQGVLVGLTAAHCTPSWAPVKSFSVVGGELTLSDTTGLEQKRNIAKIVNHDGFNDETLLNDIALLFVNEPFEINENVKTIRLPEAGQNTTGLLRLSGWGTESEDGSRNNNLQKVEVSVVDDKRCEDAYTELAIEISETYLCAGELGAGGKDTCRGDSGGPAVSVDGGYLAGVVSWGFGCGDPKFPGVNTEVSYFIDWINKNVAEYIEETKTNN